MARYTQQFDLPTMGLLEKIPAQVTIQNMTTTEEKILLGSSPDILDMIIKACIVQPENIDLDDLTAADKLYILMKIKSISYGSDYYVKHKCRSCSKVSEFKVNIDEDFDIYDLTEEALNAYIKPFELPDAGIEVSLKIPREYESEKADKETKKFIKNFPDAPGDPGYIFRMMTNIATVDGEKLDKVHLQKFVSELSGKDSSYIKHRMDKLKLGYDTTIYDVCPKCGEEVEFLMPLGVEFFRTRFND